MPLPSPPEEGLLIEVTANGICGSDRHFVSTDPTVPIVLGHEIVGTITAFGAGHSRRDAAGQPLREGGTVALFPWVPCLRCWGCRRFGPGATTCGNAFVYGVPPEAIGLEPLPQDSGAHTPTLTGGFGKHVVVRPGTYLWRVPDHVPARVASLLDPLAVAVRGVNIAKTPAGVPEEVLTFDATAVILGAGAVGLLTGLVLRHLGIGTIVVSGSRASRLDAARDIGMDVVLDTAELDVIQRREAVMELTGGLGADIVIDAANNAAALGEALGMVRRLGTVVEVGNIVPGNAGISVDPAVDVCQRNVRLLGMSFNPPRSYSEAMAMLSKHPGIPFERLITHAHTFDHLDRALADLAGDAVKVTLTA
ncbi:sorbitol dehydrogenase [Mycobacterium lacus]|uniref:Sorbitol dehydrogenase n=2 Tax=Mycobacterium lacus TaxID=169765 RepID=A0A7I7NF17_9MYCO|nr:sorbitol dehydrogenase [Mycobacterium lacus]